MDQPDRHTTCTQAPGWFLKELPIIEVPNLWPRGGAHTWPQHQLKVTIHFKASRNTPRPCDPQKNICLTSLSLLPGWNTMFAHKYSDVGDCYNTRSNRLCRRYGE